MSPKYTVSALDGAAKWCSALAKSITENFNSLSAEFSDTKVGISETKNGIKNIESKFDTLTDRLMAEVKHAHDVASEAMNIATAAQASVDTLKNTVTLLQKNVHKLTVQNKGLKEENIQLNRRSDNQDSYSRRDNLVIRGIDENDTDIEESCKVVAKNFFTQQLNISADEVEHITIVRCHRLGKKLQHNKRPIIVRFHNYADRELVWSKRFHLKNTRYSLHENYASEVEYRRRLMYPILSAARRSQNYHKVYLNGDILRIDGTDYTVETLGNLSDELNPRNFSAKENEQCYVFGGIHSSYNFLSNFYPETVSYDGIEFEDVERAYQYAKCTKFKDIENSERIMCSRSPSAAKHIGSSVKNFKSKEWDKVKEEIMLKLLKTKFSPGSDMANKLAATAGKSLAEAGQSVVYSVGMSLNNKDLFDTTKWTKNVLGKLLMKVREELM